jgi:hypothetical protein
LSSLMPCNKGNFNIPFLQTYDPRVCLDVGEFSG